MFVHAPLDSDGFLQNLDDWNHSVAQQLARTEGIVLSPAHWEVILLTRQYYHHYKLSPAMRPLVKYIKLQLGADKGNSIYLMSLFPDSPAKRISKIAGLPKPDNCL
jgi:tRNA 2-thiouridine synthesizing protein E